MTSKKINKLIVKYLTNEANKEELDYLSEWVINPKNEKVFESFVKTYYQITLTMNEPNIDIIKKNLSQVIKKDKRLFSKYNLQTKFKYAAIIVVFLSIGYFFNKDFKIEKNEIVEIEKLISKDDAITIKLDDGTFKVLDPNAIVKIKDSKGKIIGNQKKSEISYLNTDTNEKLVYNTLHIPYGKRFDLVLSDGTHIFLNSGTSIKYPVKFLDGLPRDVYLTGEAYFEVSEDKEHPFVVHSKDMNIKVLGTKFNVSSYSDNQNFNAVLVEGLVELYNDNQNKKLNNSIKLKPGFKAAWSVSNDKISIENVDTRIYTAWIDGKLIFRNATFKHIRKTLERQYNVKINNSNEVLDIQLFDATFDIESIDEIIESFSKSFSIDYKIINNEVFIY